MCLWAALSSSAVGTGFEKYVYPRRSPNSHTGPDGRVLVVDESLDVEGALEVEVAAVTIDEAVAAALSPEVPDVEATGGPDVEYSRVEGSIVPVLGTGSTLLSSSSISSVMILSLSRSWSDRWLARPRAAGAPCMVVLDDDMGGIVAAQALVVSMICLSTS